MRVAQDDRRAGDFRADVRFDSDLFGGEVEAWSAVDTVGVEQCHGGHVKVRTHADQFLGQGSAFEKTESRAGVKFDVHQWLVASGQRLKKHLLTTRH